MNSEPHYDRPSLMRKSAASDLRAKYDKTNYMQTESGGHSGLRSSKSLGCVSSESASVSANSLSESEVSQIEVFFKALKTHVYVGTCLVNLYFTKSELTDGGRNSKPRIHEWQLSRTGVPVVILDKGETRARDRRRLQICLAERGTGFVLWSDVIDNLSDYSAHHPTFHTLYLSSDHRKMAGLSFDCETAAQHFEQQMEILTSDPLNIALTGPKKSSKKYGFLRKELPLSDSYANSKLLKKCDISSPCLFQHVTSVQLNDFQKLYSLSTLMPYNQLTVKSPTPTSISASTISTESETTSV